MKRAIRIGILLMSSLLVSLALIGVLSSLVILAEATTVASSSTSSSSVGEETNPNDRPSYRVLHWSDNGKPKIIEGMIGRTLVESERHDEE